MLYSVSGGPAHYSPFPYLCHILDIFSSVKQEEVQENQCETAPGLLQPQPLTPQSGPAAPPPTTKKRGRSSRGTSEEDRWHNREEEDSKPETPRFMPARIPGPTFHTITAWSPLSLYQLFYSASVKKVFFLAPTIWPQFNFSFSGDHMSKLCGHFTSATQKRMRKMTKKWNAAEYDRLFKLKPLYTEIVNACKAHFQPYWNLSIDERMVGTKARISIKQDKKDKPTKWGYKLLVLADSSTGYTWNLFIYTGKTVMDLLPFPLLGGGYTFFTSPALFNDLSAKNIVCCGTIGKQKITLASHKPKPTTCPKRPRGGTYVGSGVRLQCAPQCIRPTVKRKVKEAGVWKNKFIPVEDSIVDYNHNMGGVDLSDARMTYYSICHKTMKSYKTLTLCRHRYSEQFPLTQGAVQVEAGPDPDKIFRFAQGSAAIPTTPSTFYMPICLDGKEVL
uniref:PiggyBac transposable element-derived protein domain-containing protein n=1 Tax=Stegastes partitus TaxID=144197 RepID=A0A3B4ZUA1_9TELE